MEKVFKDEAKMANKYMKKWSVFLAIKEVQIKRLGFHLVPIRKAFIKVTDRAPSADGSVSMVSLFQAWEPEFDL